MPRRRTRRPGDGTTTAVIIAGELLRQAGLLTEKSLHESSIIKGYQMAAEKALELVKNMAIDVSIKDKAMLRKIAATAMTGKDTDNARDFLSDMIVKCMDATLEKDAKGNYYVEKKNLVLEKKTGRRWKSPPSWKASWSTRARLTSRCRRS